MTPNPCIPPDIGSTGVITETTEETLRGDEGYQYWKEGGRLRVGDDIELVEADDLRDGVSLTSDVP